MKITKTQLRKIIKEEMLKEAHGAQGISDAGLKQAVMMVRDILDIVDHKSESGQLILRLYEFLQRGY
jgi:hypothetical protein